MKKSVSVFAFLLLFLSGASVLAADFKSVGADPAIMYNAPSERGRKVFVAPPGMPVEIVLNQDGWSKVRDASGDLSWMNTKS
jgi:SH3-like domain-containing protein